MTTSAMTRPVLLLLLSLCWLPLVAQLPDGSIAPDFQAQDINGQNWHLYDLLAQDKIVLLEFSATWCPPCWSYHKSKSMQNFYNAHGPNGDNRARVLFIESDPNTNLNCLYGQAGCNSVTPGDWVTGTPYPVIDNAAVADSFQIKYFPTIFVVCPNKKIYETGQHNAADLWQQALTCPVAKGSINAGIFDYSPGSELREICDTLPLAPQFSLINLGSNPLQSASIDLRWNNTTVQNIQWTGNLSLYGEAHIQFDALPVAGPGQLTAIVSDVNHSVYEDDTTNNVRNDQFSGAAMFNSQAVLLRIRTDQYGSETYWELRDEQGAVLDHGGNEAVGPLGGGSYTSNIGPGAYGDFALIKDTLWLPAPGCYSLHFVDAYGDGMCCEYGTGYYRLYNLNTPTSIIISGGDFGAYDHRAFGAQGTVHSDEMEDETAAQVLLFPNPATHILYADLLWLQPAAVHFTVLNALGQTVRDFPEKAFLPDEQPILLDIAELPQGMYFLRTEGQGRVVTKVFVKN